MYIKPKKRLGQNFLVDHNIRRKILKACELTASDVVFEIGAGRGEMTSLLCPQAGFVYALEIDPALCEILKDTLKGVPNVRIINQDILRFDFKKITSGNDVTAGALKNKIKVAGNIPYYITTPIIELLLENKDTIDAAFLTVQKEFALRVASKAGPKEYGSLSCFLQYHTIPQIMFHISRTCFRPVPKVDSSLLKLKMRDTPAVKTRDEKMLFAIIRAGFNKRRKTLRNSLKDLVPGNILEPFFEKYSIDRNIRPEKLSLEDFAHLADMMGRPE
jgi:16S rRNA (adenine1518-N6/adenine1519-N6)-dimethyltransferase